MKNKKKIGIIIAVAAVVVIVGAVAASFLLYSGPKSMMPAKWTDTVMSQSANVDFTGYKTVNVSGNLDGREVTASYTVSVQDDKPVVTRTEGSGDEAALENLDQNIMPNVLLTYGQSLSIVDKITDGSFGDVICMLQAYTFEIWHGDEDAGDATSELYTWNDGLALESYTVNTRPDGESISKLTFSWN